MSGASWNVSSITHLGGASWEYPIISNGVKFIFSFAFIKTFHSKKDAIL